MNRVVDGPGAVPSDDEIEKLTAQALYAVCELLDAARRRRLPAAAEAAEFAIEALASVVQAVPIKPAPAALGGNVIPFPGC